MNHGLVCIAAATLTAFGGSLLAQSPPIAKSIYGYDFVTIGDAGNRATNETERRWDVLGYGHGAVDYEYRMATKEVTVGQWFEFVEAYAPVFAANTGRPFGDPGLTGSTLSVIGSQVELRPNISLGRAQNMNWEFAARYVNWLHNGKSNEPAAFENGVYDTSTFTQNPDGTWNHQAARNPDAKFWLPTRDEWTKAAYWDPAKENGEGGYWLFPNSSDEDSRPGLLPSEGGERNAGDGPLFPLDVGSFADTQSPWGLLDMMGGESEWTETASGNPSRRVAGGSGWYNDQYNFQFSNDFLGTGDAGTVYLVQFGLRLASAVPAPTTAVIVAFAGVLILSRRRP